MAALVIDIATQKAVGFEYAERTTFWKSDPHFMRPSDDDCMVCRTRVSSNEAQGQLGWDGTNWRRVCVQVRSTR
jgi:hypothetical protein